MHQHSLDILFHFEHGIVEVHFFSELEDCAILHAKSFQCDARQKKMLYWPSLSSGFICQEPCKYFFITE